MLDESHGDRMLRPLMPMEGALTVRDGSNEAGLLQVFIFRRRDEME
jgi:hypothetical protein